MTITKQTVADKIAAVARDSKDNPNSPVRIKKVVLSHAS